LGNICSLMQQPRVPRTHLQDTSACPLGREPDFAYT